MKNTLTKKQLVSILALLLIGALLAALILLGERDRLAADEHGHGHDSHAAQQHGDETDAAGTDHGHDEEDGDGHGDRHEEGKIALDEQQIKAAGIALKTAAPATIDSMLSLPGEIRYNEDRTAHVVPRLAGVVESVHASLGQQVKKGQLLATIASPGLAEQRSELLVAQQRLALARTGHEREKTLWEQKISAEQDYLQARQALREAEIAVNNVRQKLDAYGAGTSGALNRYQLRAPLDGTVMDKHIVVGEAVKEDTDAFTISDLSTVWAEIAVPAGELNRVRVGEKASVRAFAFDAEASGTVWHVGALLGQQTRTASARIALANPQLTWRPGLFVNVGIVSGQAEVPVAVASEALHTIDGTATVFVRTADGFVARPVATGRADGRLVEITKGVRAGDEYAGAGSFVLKSELGKASAEHVH